MPRYKIVDFDLHNQEIELEEVVPIPVPEVEDNVLNVPIAIVLGVNSSRLVTVGSWIKYPDPKSYSGHILYTTKGDGTSVAEWKIDSLPKGKVVVYATWTTHTNRATNTPYIIKDDTTEVARVTVNQEVSPDEELDGTYWKKLGEFDIISGKLTVQLSNEANEYVIADAIRVEYNKPFNVTPKVGEDGRFSLDSVSYIGSFRVPSDFHATFGGSACGIDENTGNLWFAGHDKEPHNLICCLKVPSKLGRSVNVNELPRATYVVPWFDPLPTPELRPDAAQHFTVRGLLPYGDNLVGTGFGYYDSGTTITHSHWYWDGAKTHGLFRLEAPQAGYVGNYLARVPLKWQPIFSKVICGNSTGPIVTRRSTGPAAFGFDPNDLGVKDVVPTKPMIYYPAGKSWPDPGLTQYYQNTAESPMEWLRGCTAVGAAFLDDALLMIGTEGLGRVWYQNAPEGVVGACPGIGVEFGYKNRILAYDPNDLAKVVNGTLKPWEPRPYSELVLNHHPILTDPCKIISSATFNQSTNLIYVIQDKADGFLPLVHVYQVWR